MPEPLAIQCDISQDPLVAQGISPAPAGGCKVRGKVAAVEWRHGMADRSEAGGTNFLRPALPPYL